MYSAILSRKRSLSIVICFFAPLMLAGCGSDEAEADKAKTSPTAAAAATPQPNTPPESQPEMGLYNPSDQGADPSWGLPEKLSSEEIQKLVYKVVRLEKDIVTLREGLGQKAAISQQLTSGELQSAMWAKLVDRSFNDKELPLDWYEIAGDEVGFGFLAEFQHMASSFQDMAIWTVIQIRINSVKLRLIGGKPLVGDSLFLKASSYHINRENEQIREWNKRLKKLLPRLKQEFPGLDIRLNKQQEDLSCARRSILLT